MSEPERNMFGLLPCPKCGSKYRVPLTSGIVKCDDCGHEEPDAGENI